MTILFGHSRVNPSSFHLRVASIPIFEPNVKPRLEWSSTSIGPIVNRSEEHTSELQSRLHLVCRLLLEKKKKTRMDTNSYFPPSNSAHVRRRTVLDQHTTLQHVT